MRRHAQISTQQRRLISRLGAGLRFVATVNAWLDERAGPPISISRGARVAQTSKRYRAARRREDRQHG